MCLFWDKTFKTGLDWGNLIELQRKNLSFEFQITRYSRMVGGPGTEGPDLPWSFSRCDRGRPSPARQTLAKSRQCRMPLPVAARLDKVTKLLRYYSQKSLEKVLGTLKHEIDWNSNKNIISNNVYHKQINMDSDDSSSTGQGPSPDKVIWWFELIWYDLTRWSRSMWIETRSGSQEGPNSGEAVIESSEVCTTQCKAVGRVALSCPPFLLCRYSCILQIYRLKTFLDVKILEEFAWFASSSQVLCCWHVVDSYELSILWPAWNCVAQKRCGSSCPWCLIARTASILLTSCCIVILKRASACMDVQD